MASLLWYSMLTERRPATDEAPELDCSTRVKLTGTGTSGYGLLGLVKKIGLWLLLHPLSGTLMRHTRTIEMKKRRISFDSKGGKFRRPSMRRFSESTVAKTADVRRVPENSTTALASGRRIPYRGDRI